MNHTLQSIKDYCIEVDTTNEVATRKEIEAYYRDIAFKTLIRIFVSYNGLKCYREEEPEYYIKHYSIDLITLLEILEQ